MMNNRYIQITLSNEVSVNSRTDNKDLVSKKVTRFDKEVEQEVFNRITPVGTIFVPQVGRTIEVKTEAMETTVSKFERRMGYIYDKRVEKLTLPSELKTSFKIKSNAKEGSSGRVVITNMTKDSINFADIASGIAMIEIDAGYEGEGNHSVVWSGRIKDIEVESKSNGDLETTFILGAKSIWYDRAQVSVSKKGFVLTSEIIKQVLEEHEIPYAGFERIENLIEHWPYQYAQVAGSEAQEESNTLFYTEDFSFEGSLDKCIKRLIEPIKGGYISAEGIIGQPLELLSQIIRPETYDALDDVFRYEYLETKVNMHNGVLEFSLVPRAGSIGVESKIERTITLTASSGLIEVPTRRVDRANMIKVRHRLVPDIRVGVHVDIDAYDATGVFVGGNYSISSVKINGSNYEGKHEIEFEGSSLKSIVNIESPQGINIPKDYSYA